METASKKKRGRPRKHAESVEFTKTLFPGCTTTRGAQNRDYALTALEILKTDAQFRWLVDWEAWRQSGGKGSGAKWVKWGILTELGRLENEEDIREIAVELCRLRPATVRAGVAIARNWRTGVDADGDALKLANMMVSTVNAYLERHPKTTAEQLGLAVDAVREAFELG